MRILHISDTHSLLPKLKGNFDIVVHSGDIFPNFGYSIDKEKEFQLRWLETNIPYFKEWLQDKPFLFVPGNHDHVNPLLVELVLNSNNIYSIFLKEEILTFKNYNFYGFPHVPYINGSFSYELCVSEMKYKVDKMVSASKNMKIDVLVAHAPLANILDLTEYNIHIGNTIMSNALTYETNVDYYFSGHCHSSHGITKVGNMLVSNAALTQHIIEV